MKNDQEFKNMKPRDYYIISAICLFVFLVCAYFICILLFFPDKIISGFIEVYDFNEKIAWIATGLGGSIAMIGLLVVGCLFLAIPFALWEINRKTEDNLTKEQHKE